MSDATILKVWVLGCEPERLRWVDHQITRRWPAAQVSGGPELSDRAPYGLPDALVLLIDFATDVPAGAALDAMARLLRMHPGLHCIVIAENGSRLTAVRALQAGARDYLPVARITGDALLKALAEPGARGCPAVEAAFGDHLPTPPDTSRGIKVPGYIVVEEISTSNFSSVFLAESERLRRNVALKIMPKGAPGCELDDERFLREVGLISKISHRAIPEIYDFGSLPAHQYLALEYLPCGTLKDRLRNPVSIDESLYYLLTIAQALRVIHASGILHRDLKPANVMLREDNSPVLIDFGLARHAVNDGCADGAGHVIGSPYYISPEQSRGIRVDARTDLYSLGVMFYEMSTGKRPYGGRDALAIMAQHAGASVPRLPPQMSRQQTLLDRLMAKNIADRYASADELLADLAPFMHRYA